MRTLNSRLAKLEMRLGVAAPTVEELRIWELVETVRRRRAQRTGIPFVPRRREDHRPLASDTSITEILRAGRGQYTGWRQ